MINPSVPKKIRGLSLRFPIIGFSLLFPVLYLGTIARLPVIPYLSWSLFFSFFVGQFIFYHLSKKNIFYHFLNRGSWVFLHLTISCFIAILYCWIELNLARWTILIPIVIHGGYFFVGIYEINFKEMEKRWLKRIKNETVWYTDNKVVKPEIYRNTWLVGAFCLFLIICAIPAFILGQGGILAITNQLSRGENHAGINWFLIYSTSFIEFIFIFACHATIAHTVGFARAEKQLGRKLLLKDNPNPTISTKSATQIAREKAKAPMNDCVHRIYKYYIYYSIPMILSLSTLTNQTAQVTMLLTNFLIFFVLNQATLLQYKKQHYNPRKKTPPKWRKELISYSSVIIAGLQGITSLLITLTTALFHWHLPSEIALFSLLFIFFGSWLLFYPLQWLCFRAKRFTKLSWFEKLILSSKMGHKS